MGNSRLGTRGGEEGPDLPEPHPESCVRLEVSSEDFLG